MTPIARRADLSFRLPLLVAAGAIALAIGAAALVQAAGGPARQPTTTAVAARDLRFADQPDGSIAVTDAQGSAIDTIAPGQDGFIRATMRVLAQARLRRDEGPQIPFRLTAWSDGRMTLDDPQTGRRIDLEAFGHTNVDAFARLLGHRQEAAR